jgi:hypothetical protein
MNTRLSEKFPTTRLILDAIIAKNTKNLSIRDATIGEIPGIVDFDVVVFDDVWRAGAWSDDKMRLLG